ncbi:hypothetical protein I317_05716 [Kwoniella heveanensis CBS 569]|nr:hypothetical protein I317_05716 [Kwoniella heveanensis CBS 569]
MVQYVQERTGTKTNAEADDNEDDGWGSPSEGMSTPRLGGGDMAIYRDVYERIERAARDRGRDRAQKRANREATLNGGSSTSARSTSTKDEGETEGTEHSERRSGKWTSSRSPPRLELKTTTTATTAQK